MAGERLPSLKCQEPDVYLSLDLANTKDSTQ